MRILLTSLLLLLLGSAQAAEQDVATRVALALALATPQASQAQVCACGPNCTCQAGECSDPNCPNFKGNDKAKEGFLEWALYNVAYAKALKENRPLMVWIGETCPVCEDAWTGFVHARLSSYKTIVLPEVMVCRPDGLGGMDVVAHLPGCPSLATVNQALGMPSYQQQQQQQVQFRPIAQPMPMMRPMMAMGGGFGGGGGCSS